MFATARTKLTLLLAALFMLLYVGAAVAVYALMYRMTVEDEDNLLMANAKPLASSVLHSLNHGEFPKAFVNLRQLEQLYPKMSAIVLRDAMGHILADTDAAVAESLKYSYSMSLETTWVPKTHSYVRVLSIHFSNRYGQSVGWLQLALDVDHDIAALNRLRRVLVLVGAAGLLLSLVAGFAASHRALRPIARSWQRQQQFVADASHELRTPLAVIQANLDVVLQHGEQKVSDNLEWLSAIHEEIRRLTRLIGDLLTLARADSGEAAIRREEVNLLPLVRSVADRMSVLAEAKPLSLTVEADPAGDYRVHGDADRLRQLLTILVDNALKYTPSGGRVVISLSRRRRVVRLQVQDSGIGIAKEDQSRIFDRFYRGDRARERGTGGAGLGLAIAQWIVRMHRGRLSVHSEPGSGSVFTVSLRSAV
ncbi:MAG: sensor histidine kinase [Alicyclobacillaceae bacterium]|nr:sensor histidine kinase [Alicyclobacillaceae bacterium]